MPFKICYAKYETFWILPLSSPYFIHSLSLSLSLTYFNFTSIELAAPTATPVTKLDYMSRNYAYIVVHRLSFVPVSNKNGSQTIRSESNSMKLCWIIKLFTYSISRQADSPNNCKTISSKQQWMNPYILTWFFVLWCLIKC